MSRFIMIASAFLISALSGMQLACTEIGTEINTDISSKIGTETAEIAIAKEPTMNIDETLIKAEKWMDTYDFVVGVSEGKKDGQAAIYVHTSQKMSATSLAEKFPKTLDGFPVVVEYIGEASIQ